MSNLEEGVGRLKEQERSRFRLYLFCCARRSRKPGTLFPLHSFNRAICIALHFFQSAMSFLPSLSLRGKQAKPPPIAVQQQQAPPAGQQQPNERNTNNQHKRNTSAASRASNATTNTASGVKSPAQVSRSSSGRSSTSSPKSPAAGGPATPPKSPSTARRILSPTTSSGKSSSRRRSAGSSSDDHGATGILTAALTARREAKERAERLAKQQMLLASLPPPSPSTAFGSIVPVAVKPAQLDLNSLPVYMPSDDSDSDVFEDAVAEGEVAVEPTPLAQVDEEPTPSTPVAVGYVDDSQQPSTPVSASKQAGTPKMSRKQALAASATEPRPVSTHVSLLDAVAAAADQSLRLQELALRQAREPAPEKVRAPSVVSLEFGDIQMVAQEWAMTVEAKERAEIDAKKHTLSDEVADELLERNFLKVKPGDRSSVGGSSADADIDSLAETASSISRSVTPSIKFAVAASLRNVDAASLLGVPPTLPVVERTASGDLKPETKAAFVAQLRKAKSMMTVLPAQSAGSSATPTKEEELQDLIAFASTRQQRQQEPINTPPKERPSSSTDLSDLLQAQAQAALALAATTQQTAQADLEWYAQPDNRASIWLGESDTKWAQLLETDGMVDGITTSPVLPRKMMEGRGRRERSPSVASSASDSSTERVLEALGSIVTATHSELLSTELESRKMGGRRKARENKKKAAAGLRTRSRSRSKVRFDHIGGVGSVEAVLGKEIVNELEQQQQQQLQELQAQEQEISEAPKYVDAQEDNEAEEENQEDPGTPRASRGRGRKLTRSPSPTPIEPVERVSIDSIPEPLASSPIGHPMPSPPLPASRSASVDKHLPTLATVPEDGRPPTPEKDYPRSRSSAESVRSQASVGSQGSRGRRGYNAAARRKGWFRFGVWLIWRVSRKTKQSRCFVCLVPPVITKTTPLPALPPAALATKQPQPIPVITVSAPTATLPPAKLGLFSRTLARVSAIVNRKKPKTVVKVVATASDAFAEKPAMVVEREPSQDSGSSTVGYSVVATSSSTTSTILEQPELEVDEETVEAPVPKKPTGMAGTNRAKRAAAKQGESRARSRSRGGRARSVSPTRSLKRPKTPIDRILDELEKELEVVEVAVVAKEVEMVQSPTSPGPTPVSATPSTASQKASAFMGKLRRLVGKA